MLLKKYSSLGAGVARLIWMEYRVGPMKINDRRALDAFDEFFARPDLM